MRCLGASCRCACIDELNKLRAQQKEVQTQIGKLIDERSKLNAEFSKQRDEYRKFVAAEQARKREGA